MRHLIVLLAFSLSCCLLWAGYTHKHSRPVVRDLVFNAAEKSYDTANASTTEELAIKNAQAFAAAAVAHCSGSGGATAGNAPPTLSEIASVLAEAVASNRFCKEGVKEEADSYLATTKNDPAIPGSTGTTLEYHSTNGTPPGINLSERLFPSNVDTGSQPWTALLASVLMHEAGHVAAGHDSNTEDPELLAYEQEASFICCALSYAATLPNSGPITAVLCARLQSVANSYYCVYGGTGTIACAECTMLTINCESIPGVASAPSPVLPRPPVDPCSRIMDWTFYTTTRGLFEASLFPCNSELHITQYDDSGASQWEFDLSSQPEGTFRPLTMVAGRNAEVFVAGRIEGSTESAIYQIDFGWSGASPTLTTTLIYLGAAVGDILGLEYVKQLNNKLAVFDYTNAAVWYVDTTGVLAPVLVANPASHSALLGVRSMGKRGVKWGPSGQKQPALILLFQEAELLDVSSTNETVPTLLLTDILGDGTIDDAETILL
jgi:hypothetical protein